VKADSDYCDRVYAPDKAREEQALFAIERGLKLEKYRPR